MSKRVPVSQTFRRSSAAVASFVLIGLVWPSSAHAYLDPGTGSYLLQMVMAMLVSAGFLVRRFWSNIVGLRNRSSSSPSHRSEPDEGP